MVSMNAPAPARPGTTTDLHRRRTRRLVFGGLATVAMTLALVRFDPGVHGVVAASGVPVATGDVVPGDAVPGDVAQTRYGPVQVAVSVSGGTITAVNVLQYPAGNSRDQQINGYALPRLVQQTLDHQSAQVDMISGATYTSQGYAASLQSALDKAGL